MVAKTFELSLKDLVDLERTALGYSFVTAIEKNRLKQFITKFEGFYRNKLILQGRI